MYLYARGDHHQHHPAAASRLLHIHQSTGDDKDVVASPYFSAGRCGWICILAAVVMVVAAAVVSPVPSQQRKNPKIRCVGSSWWATAALVFPEPDGSVRCWRRWTPPPPPFPAARVCDDDDNDKNNNNKRQLL
jgi:hypothetical protein